MNNVQVFLSYEDYDDEDDIRDRHPEFEFIVECEGGWMAFMTQTGLEMWEGEE
jgi:hypothetical protein